jgi:hypothetical protein
MVITLWGFCLFSGTAQTTYKDVAPIFYGNCISCHNPNGIGPMSLLNYSEAFAYKSFIRRYVSLGIMPPWLADTSYHHFFGERVLTSSQVRKIIDWIDSGALKGDTTLAPLAPIPINDYKLNGTPDLIIKIPKFTSNATTLDVCDRFVIPTWLTQDRFVRAFEIVVGNPAIVHHVMMGADTTGAIESDFSGVTFTMPDSAEYMGGFAPGAGPTVYPSKYPLKIGFRLKAKSSIVLQIHYPAGTGGKIDSTQVRFFFYPLGTKGIRQIYTAPIFVNWRILIPPNTVKEYTVRYPENGGLPTDISLYSAFPHQHKVGVSIVNYAYRGGDTIPLIRIKRWDFRWQSSHTFPKLVKVPEGYTLFSSHIYDNTTNNPNNPFNPPQTIKAGVYTTNEMLVDYYQYLYYEPGDDTINIANILSTDTLLAVHETATPVVSTNAFPTPFDKLVHIGFTLNAPSNNLSIVIYNISGTKVKTLVKNRKAFGKGYYECNWDGIGDNGNVLPSGVYIYSVTANKINRSGRLVISRQ